MKSSKSSLLLFCSEKLKNLTWLKSSPFSHKFLFVTFAVLLFTFSTFAQNSSMMDKGISQELAKWRATNYSDVRYKLNLTIEKKAPTLKGSIEVSLKSKSKRIILDWRKIKGSEHLSKTSNVSINGTKLTKNPQQPSPPNNQPPMYSHYNEHLIFEDGAKIGENIIKLDFESPILTSGSAITRYIDKEDGSEYIYSLFVPSDASTAFPVFDQPDLKAKFFLTALAPRDWKVVSNNISLDLDEGTNYRHTTKIVVPKGMRQTDFFQTKPISTYVFAFSAGNFKSFLEPFEQTGKSNHGITRNNHQRWGNKIYVRKSQAEKFKPHAKEIFRLNRESIKYFENYFDYKFPFPKYDLVLIPEFPFGGMEHAGATFLRESSIIFPTEPTANNYISRASLLFHENAHQWFGDTVTMKWFDDLWLKEGFATFMAYKAMEKVLPEYDVWKVFYERTKQRAYLTDVTKGTTPIYQEIRNLNSAKSAYGNIVYQKAPSFLKQAEFYFGDNKFQKAIRAFLKKYEFGNAEWKDLVKEFEKVACPANYSDTYAYDSKGKRKKITKCLDNKNKKSDLGKWSKSWVLKRGVPIIRVKYLGKSVSNLMVDGGIQKKFKYSQKNALGEKNLLEQKFDVLIKYKEGKGSLQIHTKTNEKSLIYRITELAAIDVTSLNQSGSPQLVFPNKNDNGYGIFLLDKKSKKYVLRNIQSEKDDFLRSMMWGSLWDSVRFNELDPKDYVELAIKNIEVEKDVSTISSILGRVSTAMRYYIPEGRNLTAKERANTQKVSNKMFSDGNVSAKFGTLPSGRDSARSELSTRLEKLLINKMQTAKTQGERITFYRAFLRVASSENARKVLKDLLKNKKLNETGRNPNVRKGANEANLKSNSKIKKERTEIYRNKKIVKSSKNSAPFLTVGSLPLRTRDKFNIVTRLIILGDKDAPKLLAELEKTEKGDAAKRYAYAAKAGFATKENKAKYWNDFVNNKEISESWIEAAFGVWNSASHSELTLPYLEKALAELPNHKQNRKIFFVNGWTASFIGGQKSEKAFGIVNKFLKDNPKLDIDLQRKILERLDGLERAVKIRKKYAN